MLGIGFLGKDSSDSSLSSWKAVVEHKAVLEQWEAENVNNKVVHIFQENQVIIKSSLVIHLLQELHGVCFGRGCCQLQLGVSFTFGVFTVGNASRKTSAWVKSGSVSCQAWQMIMDCHHHRQHAVWKSMEIPIKRSFANWFPNSL